MSPDIERHEDERLSNLLNWYQDAANDTMMAEGIVPIKVSDYLSPYLPLGFDTVLGWLAKNDPVVLSMMDETPEATARDGFWLCHRCKALGIKPVKVPASAFLVRMGLFDVNSYPVELLAERFRH